MVQDGEAKNAAVLQCSITHGRLLYCSLRSYLQINEENLQHLQPLNVSQSVRHSKTENFYSPLVIKAVK
jgi:hypothetical protein